MTDFAVLKRENDLLDLQEEMKVEGFTKVCNCTGNTDKKALTLDYVLASANLFTDGWVQNFEIQAHMATSDHLPLTIEVDSGLFGKMVEYIPLEETGREHEQCCGNHLDKGRELLEELETASLSMLLEDRVADLTDIDDNIGSELLQLLTQQGKTFLRKWDPDGTGVVSCEDINSLFAECPVQDKEEHWLDVTSAEMIQVMDYVQEAPKTLRVEIKIRVGKEDVVALVDSGASKSILKWEALVRMLGETRAKQVLFKDGYIPYFKIADGSVIQSKGQVGLQFTVGGKQFTHVFYVLVNCSQQVILGAMIS
jgi:hypothetical protein